MFPHGAQKALRWFGNQKGKGFEYHLLAIGLALVVMIQGPEKFLLMLQANHLPPGARWRYRLDSTR